MSARVILLVLLLVAVAVYIAALTIFIENDMPPAIVAWVDWILNDVLGIERWEPQQYTPSS